MMSELTAAPASLRWRPWWATVIAVLLGAPAVAVFGIGIIVAVTAGDQWVGPLVAIVGVIAALAVLPALVPLVIYLVRGGRVPFYLGLVYALCAGAYVVQVVLVNFFQVRVTP